MPGDNPGAYRFFDSRQEASDMEILKVTGLKKVYGSGNNAVHALDGIDLTVEEGEFLAVQSGTLYQCLP